MPHKDFDVPEVGPDDDPITFTLGPRKFTCVPVIPYTTRLMVSGVNVYLRDMHRVIVGCLVEDDVPAFEAALADKARPLDRKRVEDVFWYIIESYSEREGSNDPIAVRGPAVTESAG